MENVSLHEPPVGGRINPPQFRGAARLVNQFEGLPKGVTRFDLLRLVKQAALCRVQREDGPATRMLHSLLPAIATGPPMAGPSSTRPFPKPPSISASWSARFSGWDLFTIGGLNWNDAGNHRCYGTRPDEGEASFEDQVTIFSPTVVEPHGFVGGQEFLVKSDRAASQP
jgi:hypothetical protein